MNGRILLVSYIGGARGDFLANIITNSVNNAFQHFSRVTPPDYPYIKVHPNHDENVIAYNSSHLDSLDKNSHDAAWLLHECRARNVYTIRIHTGFDQQSLENLHELERQKQPIFWTMPAKVAMEKFDFPQLHLYNAVIDFRDLWSLDTLEPIVTKIRGKELTLYEQEMIQYNINIQPALPNKIKFDTPSITKINTSEIYN